MRTRATAATPYDQRAAVPRRTRGTFRQRDGKDCARRRHPVNGADDRPRHDEMAGAGADRLGRRHHPLLVARVGTGGPDARGHHGEARTDHLADGGCLVRRADNAAHAGLQRLLGATQHQRVRVVFITGVDHVLLVHRGEHGDGKQAKVGAARGRYGGAHRLGISVQGEHRHAHPDDVLDALRHRVVDVEQFHVEEDFGSSAR